MKKRLMLFSALFSALFAVSSCRSTLGDDITEYFQINDIKHAVVSASYKSCDGIELTLTGSLTWMKVFVSSDLIGKKIDLATLQSTESTYWTIQTEDGPADSRTPRSDSGTIYLNMQGDVCTIDMDVVLGHGYCITSQYTGTPVKKDNSGTIKTES